MTVLLLLLLLLLFWFMIPTSMGVARPPVLLTGAEPYKNEPSSIQFTNAEFKFYK